MRRFRIVGMTLLLASLALAQAPAPEAPAPEAKRPVREFNLFVKEWSWEPARVVFDGLRADSAATRTVTLTQHPDAPPAELGHISAPSPLLAEVVPGGDAGAGGRRQWTLRLTTVPPLPAGRSDRSVYAYTQGSAVMIGPIPVALIVEDPRGE